MPIKRVKMKISKNKKMRFFLMSQGSFDQKIRFLDLMMCSVARGQTDRRTDGRTDTHEIFPSTYHQGAVQKKDILWVFVLPFPLNTGVKMHRIKIQDIRLMS